MSIDASQPAGVPVDHRVLGQGWAAPVRLGADGELGTDSGAEKVRQSILLIVSTRRGERVMRPDFGAGLEDFLFEPASTTTAALIRHRVETSLVLWEPRIDVIDVAVQLTGRRTGRLDITIRYRIRSTNTFYNLVYPFFLREGGPV
jgi:phage baseplate assembly protein W